jgi:hypothetical protein
MNGSKSAFFIRTFFLTAVLLVGIQASASLAQSAVNHQTETISPAAEAPSQPRPDHHSSSPYRTTGMTTHARARYEALWGIDSLEVKSIESGQLLRFSYLVLDPEKAAQLNDKKTTPYLIDPEAGVRLQVPVLDKVGQLRQTATPEAGNVYWMVFSNKGRAIKPGARVSVQIGNFRADGLYVK